VREVHERASGYARGISLEGVVEVDEVYVHAGENREEAGGKGPEAGVEEEGEGDLGRGSAAGSHTGQKGEEPKVRFCGMKNLRGVKKKRKEWIRGEVVLNTDEYGIYRGIAEEVEKVKEHRVVNHRQGEWARGEAHGNGCENRNGFLRAFLRKYRGVSKTYLTGLSGLFEPLAQ